MKQKLKNFYTNMVLIQTEFRLYKSTLALQLKTFEDIIFEKGKNKLTELCLKNKNPRKNLVFKKIMNLDPATKIAACKAYQERCKLRYKAMSLDYKVTYNMKENTQEEVSLVLFLETKSQRQSSKEEARTA